MTKTVLILGAGSLRTVLTEIADTFRAGDGTAVEADFAASGTLRRAIEDGRPCHVFASADMDHPARLFEAGLAEAPLRFCGNRLVALCRPGLAPSPDALLDALLAPDVRLGTSTPGCDPSGDYADTLFDRADALRPGAAAALKAKALRLTGAPDSPKPDDGSNLYAWVVGTGAADVFLTYATNALRAVEEDPALCVVEIPVPLAVRADYGLGVLTGAPDAARRFARLVLSPAGRAVLARHGFETDPIEAEGDVA